MMSAAACRMFKLLPISPVSHPSGSAIRRGDRGGGDSGGIEILSREIGAREKRHELIDVG